MVTSSNLAETILKMVQEELPEIKVKIYTGNNLSQTQEGTSMYMQKVEDFKNVSTSWECDLLLYTSTVTAGVNFAKSHFDSFVHCFVANTCDALAFV
jgi:hypothetical protein